MDNYDKHESYGMIQIVRTSGSSRHLFGSSIPHNNTIRLSVHPAELRRDLSNDWYYPASESYIEVEMSATQWAEAITNMNTAGVPVTIRRIQGRLVEDCPFVSKREQFQGEFADKMRRVAQSLSILEELAVNLTKTKAPNVEQKAFILKEVQRLKMELGSNMPFVAAQFNEQMDKTVLEAKGEFEAAVLHTILSLGLKEMKAQQFRLLGDGEGDGDEG